MCLAEDNYQLKFGCAFYCYKLLFPAYEAACWNKILMCTQTDRRVPEKSIWSVSNFLFKFYTKYLEDSEVVMSVA